MFQEFLALKDVDCRWGRGVLGHYRQKRCGQVCGERMERLLYVSDSDELARRLCSHAL